MTSRLELADQRFGQLTCVLPLPRGEWLCRCDCGRHRVVHGGRLRLNRVQACARCEQRIVRQKAAELALREQAMLEDYFSNGLSFQELSEKYQIAQPRVVLLCRHGKYLLGGSGQSGLSVGEKVERNKQIRRAYQAGVSQTELARRYGISRQAVHVICRRRSDKAALRDPNRLRARNTAIVEAYRQGVSVQELAVRHNLSVIRIRQIVSLAKAGCARTDNRERDSQIYRAYQSGVSVADLAAAYRLSPRRIYGICRRAASQEQPSAEDAEPVEDAEPAEATYQT